MTVINQFEMPDTEAFMSIREIHGIFVDSVLTDEADNLVMISLWGRDTSIRELQSRITLGDVEGGLSAFNLVDSEHKIKCFVKVGDKDKLEQMTGRVHTTILGELVHCFLYPQEIIKPDLANHRAILIYQSDDAPDSYTAHLWNMIKAICPIPVLDHWGGVLIPIMKQTEMITSLTGIRQCGIKIAIDIDRLADIVKQGCLDKRLA